MLLFLAVAVVAIAAAYSGYRAFLRVGRPASPEPAEHRASRPGKSASKASAAAARPAATAEHRVSEPEPPLLDAHEAVPDPAGGPPPVPEVRPVPPGGARVALVVDDLGRSVGDVEALAGLGVPLTYAVLPFEERTAAVVADLRRRGAEYLLHLPMQGQEGANPGPGALTLAMSDDELTAATTAALDAVPGAAGVNNHMGSVLTADERAMRAVLGVVAGRHLFFVDSRTSAASVAYRLAATLDLPAAERQVFLDPDPRPEAIRYQFARLLNLARERGSAVAIGHPHPATLEVLREEIPRARSLGYELVPVSYLLDRGSSLPP